jgi:molecular chaperone GrpE
MSQKENITEFNKESGNSASISNFTENRELYIVNLKMKCEENFKIALRAKAEVENIKKRTDELIKKEKKEANDGFIFDFLTLLDSVEYGLNIAKGDVLAKKENTSVYTGLRLIHEMMVTMLGRFGIVELSALHKKFNPFEHEAVMLSECAEEPGIVVEVYQNGYGRDGRILRHSKVVVSK